VTKKQTEDVKMFAVRLSDLQASLFILDATPSKDRQIMARAFLNCTAQDARDFIEAGHLFEGSN
jgi:hypothetical protein